ncbi:hypothetical protein ACFQER_09790 [Halomicroarcula sp. GCM10025894]
MVADSLLDVLGPVFDSRQKPDADTEATHTGLERGIDGRFE